MQSMKPVLSSQYCISWDYLVYNMPVIPLLRRIKSLRLFLTMKCVQGQPRLHEILSQKIE